MTRDDFLENVREANRTALSRLGSSKALYADTRGDVAEQPVLRAAATRAHAAAETFEAWAEDSAGYAAETYREAADTEREHYETAAAALGDDALDDLPAVQAHLRDLEGDVERAGGFLGRALVAEQAIGQLTAFFVGQADPGTSQQFREMGEDVDALIDRGLDLLAELCEDADDWEHAREAASGAVQAAYDEYTERLEAMGVNPKPVC